MCDVGRAPRVRFGGLRGAFFFIINDYRHIVNNEIKIIGTFYLAAGGSGAFRAAAAGRGGGNPGSQARRRVIPATTFPIKKA